MHILSLVFGLTTLYTASAIPAPESVYGGINFRGYPLPTPGNATCGLCYYKENCDKGDKERESYYTPVHDVIKCLEKLSTSQGGPEPHYFEKIFGVCSYGDAIVAVLPRDQVIGQSSYSYQGAGRAVQEIIDGCTHPDDVELPEAVPGFVSGKD